MSRAWEVFEHGNLQPFGSNLWMVRGTLPRVPLPRNMVVYRMTDGRLWIHSAIAMDEERMEQLEALGKPAFLIVPNRFHRFDALRYKHRYPDIEVLCPRDAQKKVEKVLPVNCCVEDTDLEELGVRWHSPRGAKLAELTFELSMPDGHALVFTDLLFHLGHLPGINGWVMKKIGTTGFFGVTNVEKLFFLKDKKQFAAWLEKMAEVEELKALFVAHGKPIVEDCSERLHEAAKRLMGK